MQFCIYKSSLLANNCILRKIAFVLRKDSCGIESEFFSILQARPQARDLFISYTRLVSTFRGFKHEFLRRLSLSTGRFEDSAFMAWKESWELAKDPMASKGAPLHGSRIKLIERAQSLFLETKEHVFESKATEEHAKLLRC